MSSGAAVEPCLRPTETHVVPMERNYQPHIRCALGRRHSVDSILPNETFRKKNTSNEGCWQSNRTLGFWLAVFEKRLLHGVAEPSPTKVANSLEQESFSLQRLVLRPNPIRWSIICGLSNTYVPPTQQSIFLSSGHRRLGRRGHENRFTLCMAPKAEGRKYPNYGRSFTKFSGSTLLQTGNECPLSTYHKSRSRTRRVSLRTWAYDGPICLAQDDIRDVVCYLDMFLDEPFWSLFMYILISRVIAEL